MCEEFLKDAGDNSSRIYELNGIIEGVVCDEEVNEAEFCTLKSGWMPMVTALEIINQAQNYVKQLMIFLRMVL